MPAELHESLGQFAQALLSPSRPRPSFLVADDKRFDVYRNNVTLGLMRALQANFPAIRRLVGAEFFDAMAVDYVRAHPPQSRLLFEFGAHLPEFLHAAPALQAYSYLPDVARFEWAWLQSFHEADAPVLDAENLTNAINANPDALYLAMHPAARLLHAPNAFFRIAEASREGRSLQGIAAAEPEFCLITRPAITMQCRCIAPSEYEFLHAIAAGNSLQQAAETALDVQDDFDLPAAITLLVTAGFCTAATKREG